jgi:outer membrane receptor protein involved in Fe transport
VSLQAAWDPSTDKTLSATVFYSKLTDHVSEDPYGGISKPADQNIIGLELAGRARLLKHLDLFGNLTALDNWGGSEEYEFLDRVFIRPDGTRVEVYEKWKQSYDEGPDLIANLGFIWQLHPKITVSVDGGITSKVPYAYARDTVSGHYDQEFLLDATFKVKDVMLKGATLTLRGTNLLDQNYTIPGLYGPVDGPPFEFYVEWALRF